MGRVDGKVALVTGGAMGLGKADCERLAEEGARVIVTDIDENGAKAVAAAIGGGAIGLRLDVANEAEWKSVFDQVEEQFGALHILVNNAGIVIPETIEDTSTENFRTTMAIHVEGTFHGCKFGIPLMAKSGGGSIINMASMASILGYSIFFSYSAAKGGIRSMTKSIAMHCQEQANGIRCNVLMPSGIETPMVQTVGGRQGQAEPVPDGVLGPVMLSIFVKIMIKFGFITLIKLMSSSPPHGGYRRIVWDLTIKERSISRLCALSNRVSRRTIHPGYAATAFSNLIAN